LAGIGIGITVTLIFVVFAFTNVDELVSPTITASLEQVEIDTRSINIITNTFPVNTMCQYALLIEEASRPPFSEHSQWYNERFGDIQEDFKEKVTEFSLRGGRFDSEEGGKIIRDFYEKLKPRINPTILEQYQQFPTLPHVSPKQLEEDPECAELLKEMEGYR